MSKKVFEIDINLFCRAYNLTLAQEFRFDTSRRWKSDFYILEFNCLIEFEGMGGNHWSGIGGHQTLTGYTANCEKYNRASLMGFKLLRYTAKNSKDLLNDLKTLLYEKTNGG
jgi:hypothetical protein